MKNFNKKWTKVYEPTSWLHGDKVRVRHYEYPDPAGPGVPCVSKFFGYVQAINYAKGTVYVYWPIKKNIPNMILIWFRHKNQKRRIENGNKCQIP